MKKTPLYDVHVKLRAKVIEFGGWMMPVQYSNVIDEHTTTRTKVGLFDICHMGEVLVFGPEAIEFLQHIATNDISKIEPGKSAYSAMCYENGTTVDDIFVYCFNDDSYFVVVNASTSEKDVAWMKKHSLGFDVTVEDKSEHYAMLSIQGPYAEKTLQKITEYPLSSIQRFGFVENYVLEKIKTIISRTGYTGEDGFEIFFDSNHTVEVWEALMAAGKEFGLKPIGLGARDTLRLESCYSLYGHELSDKITPLEAGIDFAVKLEKPEFIGKEALQKQNKELKRKIVAFQMNDGSIPRNEYEIYDKGRKIGFVTSGTFSPTFRKGIGLAMVDINYSEIGTKLNIKIRNELHEGAVVKRPIYRYTGKKY